MGATMARRRQQAARKRKIRLQAQADTTVTNEAEATKLAEEAKKRLLGDYDYKTDPNLSKQKKAAITKKINADPTYVFTQEMANSAEA